MAGGNMQIVVIIYYKNDSPKFFELFRALVIGS